MLAKDGKFKHWRKPVPDDSIGELQIQQDHFKMTGHTTTIKEKAGLRVQSCSQCGPIILLAPNVDYDTGSWICENCVAVVSSAYNGKCPRCENEAK